MGCKSAQFRVSFFHGNYLSNSIPTSAPFVASFLAPVWILFGAPFGSPFGRPFGPPFQQTNIRKLKGFGAFRWLKHSPFWSPFWVHLGPHFGALGTMVGPWWPHGDPIAITCGSRAVIVRAADALAVASVIAEVAIPVSVAAPW